MPNYANAEGGVFFFTVTLVDHSSNLLFNEIDRLRRVYRAVQERHPLKRSPFAFCPTTSMLSGHCRNAGYWKPTGAET